MERKQIASWTDRPEIALYGTARTGAGFLATYHDWMVGDGDPHDCLTFTTVIRVACRQLKHLGARGTVDIHYDGTVATTSLEDPQDFGKLDWRMGPRYEISAEDLKRASDPR